MARPKKRFAQLIEEIDRTPWGPHEQNLVTEAVALAMEIGDDQLEYQARMRQTASANMGGLTDLMLNSFAWCLARHDADPARFPADIENGAADLLWQFKWMAASLRSSPRVRPGADHRGARRHGGALSSRRSRHERRADGALRGRARRRAPRRR